MAALGKVEGGARWRWRARARCEQDALARDPRRHRRRCLLHARIIRFDVVLIDFVAAFDYDYNALDGGDRSPISKGYDNIMYVHARATSAVVLSSLQ